MRARMSLLAAALVLVAAATPSAAVAKSVSVTITHVECIDDCDEVGLEGIGQSTADFYAKVHIDGVAQNSPHIEDDKNIDPYWPITRTVPDAQQFVGIAIEIFDQDGTLPTGTDDNGDVSPRNDDNPLDLVLDTSSLTWNGPDTISSPQSCATGDGGDDDEPSVKVCFALSTSADGDFDDDGIPDGIELNGIPDSNGNLVPLPSQMDPCRKTIALQIDWLAGAADGHNHRPSDAAVNDAVAAMNAAPPLATPGCPYTGFPQQPAGVNLVIDRKNPLPEQEVFTLANLATTRDSGKFPAARRPYMHYVVFAHDQKKDSSSSGLCCVSNRDYIATLGHWTNQVGNFREQSGTILHELGHALGLGHGGANGVNYKPNYLSVMNYTFDPLGIPDSTIPANYDTDGNGTLDQSYRLDYSRSALASIDETSVNESSGIQDGTDQTLWWDPAYKLQAGAGTGAIDWNSTAPPNESGYKNDLNRDFCVDAGADGTLDTTPTPDDQVVNGVILAGPNFICNTAKANDDTQNTPVGTNVLSTLTGYDDWANIKYRAAMSVNAGGADTGHPDEITRPQAQEIESATFAAYRPDLTEGKSVDKTTASPGDKLTYTLTTRDVGTGDAKDVAVKDTLPDASSTTLNVGSLAAGATDTRTVTYDIPCATTDGASLTNSASVSGTNVLNNPEVDTANNSASASTTVRAPKMTLDKTASSVAGAGEAVTYRLTYENVGTGDAKSIVITDTLPADVYYSVALDTGAGPKPATVTKNANGTTTLMWTFATLAGSSGPQTIEYRARPSLLFLPGAGVSNTASLSFTNANGCSYAALGATAPTTIAVTPITRNPLSHGYWKTHAAEWTVETLARIQATDQRYDGIDGSLPNGQLAPPEVAVTLGATGGQERVLRFQLLATYFDLATRRIGPGTLLDSKTTVRLGLTNVRAAALYAIATLALPPTTNKARYDDAIAVLDDIVNNRSEVY